MDDFATAVAYYRAKAAEFAALAKEAKTPELQRESAAMAAAYLRVAIITQDRIQAAQIYREKAQECLKQAQALNDPSIRHHYTTIAIGYQTLAQGEEDLAMVATHAKWSD